MIPHILHSLIDIISSFEGPNSRQEKIPRCSLGLESAALGMAEIWAIIVEGDHFATLDLHLCRIRFRAAFLPQHVFQPTDCLLSDLRGRKFASAFQDVPASKAPKVVQSQRMHPQLDISGWEKKRIHSL